MNSQGILNQLQQKHYAQIPFAIDPQQVNGAVQAFMKFLELDEDIKNTIDFTIAPKHRRGDIGYKHRNSEDHMYDDSKDFFHYHPALHHKYEEFLKQNPLVESFMNKAKPIWDKTYETIDLILTSIEPEFPGLRSQIMDTEDVHILLRFLRYDWAKSGKYLAKPHYDAGAFTLAIAESCPGLRIGITPENLESVSHKEGTAIFMVASNYQKIIETSNLLPAWHDVIQVDETIIGKPFSRWAVVAFIEAHGVEALSRTETHKWYKEIPA